MLRILMLEDNPDDAALIERELKMAGFSYTAIRVDRINDFVAQLSEFKPDLVLADYALPGFDGAVALKELQDHNVDIPFILVSGTIGEEIAFEVLKHGANGFVPKTSLFCLKEVVKSAVDHVHMRKSTQSIGKLALELMERVRGNDKFSWDGKLLKLLVLEDNSSDVDLISAQFRHESAQFDFIVVQTKSDFEEKLRDVSPDMILADFSLPSFDGLSALKIRNEVASETPFIFVSGILGEEVAIDSLKLGATDYVLKDKIARLLPVVRSAWESAQERRYRKEAEEQLAERQEITRNILEGANDVILTIELSGSISMANPSFERVFGVPVADAIGQQFRTFVPDADLQEAADGDRRFTSLKHSELVGNRNGVSFPIDMSMNEIEVRGKHLIIAIVSDVTERKRLQDLLASQIKELEAMNEELKLARDEAIEAWRLKSEFVANISHEIRTPMGGIIGLADLLVDSDLDDYSRILANDILQSGKQLLVVVNDLLDFSKLQAGKLNLTFTEFDIRDLVENVSGLVHRDITKKELAYSTTVDERIPAKITGDRVRIQQALLNLVHNAVKFTAKGSIDVHVELNMEEGTRPMIKFSVDDDGIGIPESAQKKIFEPFVQADGSTTRKYGGTGLGLSITKNLVQLMSGQMGLSSKEGDGTLFWFTVPLLEGNKTVAAPPEQSK